MSITKTRTAAALGAIVLMLPLASFAADPLDPVQELLDRAAINELLVRYTHALDALDAYKYASVFTPNAVFEQGDNREARGRRQIRDIITRLIASRELQAAEGSPPPPMMHHVMTNATLEFVSDTEAHHTAYWMTIIGGDETGFGVAAMGHYEDVIVKRDGEWLIDSRKLLN